ncbi:DNA replication and repair protein RecF [SAR86 cluster bacterium]|jgi:DNA replication and repair protein RecF|nr:DNA replication and repair protein RecF [SAR86 cluster bacterium]|tara:strand:+ start:11601 stop:12626 length:1026 start_codon:yes stop_codon:yes gene_type:complete
MYLSKIHLVNFRLFSDSLFNLQETTLITGKNGAGKTSVLEAIHVILKSRSFRTSSMNSLINLNEDNFLINAKLDSKTLTFEKKRRSAPVNNGYKTLSYKYENFPVLINNFSLAFLESDKEVRRRFLDYFMFHVKHDYIESHRKFKKTLSTRNRALKKNNEEEINIWTKLLLEQAEKITADREEILNQVTSEIPQFFKKLPLDERWKDIGNKLSLKFNRGWEEGQLIEVLRSNFQEDMRRGFTKFGPQRFDLEINILKEKAGDVLSRGEQKLLILLIFLCFGEFISEKIGKKVFYLVDDAAAELDEENLILAFKSLEKVNGQKIISAIKKPENIKLNNVIDL